MDKYIGKVLSDRYILNEVIGVGGMAQVYKAYDKLINRDVAVKILKDEFGENTQFRRRFSNESRVISLLSHANIVDVYDVNLEGDLQYIVMEYVNGITLKEYISHKGRLEHKEAIFITEQILGALTHAHERGIIHRDIKPHNIMLLSDKTVKVADFGIARATKFDTVTMTDKAIGSVHYISPEQASGGKTDEKSDIYSVGVMLYEMTTGSLPFEGDTPVTVALMQVQSHPKFPSAINPLIFKGLEEIILKAMMKNPENRYESAESMLDDLQKLKADERTTFGYTYIFDESPTKQIDDIEAFGLKTKKKKSEYVLPIVLGIVTAFIFFLVGIGLLLWNGSESGTSEMIEVPDFVGKEYNEIINNPDLNKGFIITRRREEASDKYDINVVMGQDKEKGIKIAKGSEVKVDISTGINVVKIPNVNGFGYAQAYQMLINSKFMVEPKYETSETVKDGDVIRTDPAGESFAAHGSKVTVYVSSGAQKETVAVPNVINMYVSEAVEKIREAGLTPEIEYTIVSGASETGRVTKQTPTGGSRVDAGTRVVITVTEAEDEGA